MAAFNPSDYETVAERIKRFYTDYPHGRIITKNLTTKEDRLASTWVVRTKIYIPNPLTKEGPFHEEYILKSTGLAFEVDGQGMANKTSALENAETSSIGRALANAGYSGDKRASREEMEKVNRAASPKPVDATAVVKMAEDLAWKKDLDGLINLYNQLVATKAPADLIEKVKQIGNDTRGSIDTAK